MKEVHIIAASATFVAALYTAAISVQHFKMSTVVPASISSVGFMAGVWLSLALWRLIRRQQPGWATEFKGVWLYSLLCVLCVSIVGMPVGILVVAYLTHNALVLWVGALMGGITFGEVAALGVLLCWLYVATRRILRGAMKLSV